MTWVHRDRVLQVDRLIDCSMDDIGPEPGTQYHLTLTALGETEPVWSLILTDNHVVLPYDSSTSSRDAQAHYLQIWTECNGRRSLETFTTLLPAGLIVIEPEEPIEMEVTDV